MKRLLTRADDFGSGRGANRAILEACDGGFIQNVSVMAGGPFVEEGADVLARSGKCIGMHAVLNSEWDRVKWTPCAPKKNIPSLLDEDGEFPWQTAWFLEHPPELSEILREFDLKACIICQRCVKDCPQQAIVNCSPFMNPTLMYFDVAFKERKDPTVII